MTTELRTLDQFENIVARHIQHGFISKFALKARTLWYKVSADIKDGEERQIAIQDATHYYLESTKGGDFELPQEVGRALASAWTRKTNTRYDNDTAFVGVRSMESIARLLSNVYGFEDVYRHALFAASKAKIEADYARTHYNMLAVQDAANSLLEALNTDNTGLDADVVAQAKVALQRIFDAA